MESILSTQITTPGSPWCGSQLDDLGMHTAAAAGGVILQLATAFVHPRSKFHGQKEVLERLRLAAGFVERSLTPQGFIDYYATNFNSPPDTGFSVQNIATAAAVGRRGGNEEIVRILRPCLQKMGAGLAVGGIHTPNHRWVVSAALAQVNELFPDARYVHRIDQWLAEGVDIDADGQFVERSTLTYNIHIDHAFLVMAAKLNRPELLEPVRRNLHSMLYLLHEDGEVVSEISGRQDKFTRGNMGGYWFSLAYLALKDHDGQLGALAARYIEDNASLPALMEYPELMAPLPAPQPLPQDYEKAFPAVGIARIRRGPVSATLILDGTNRIFTLRNGDAVINAVRFATAFFGKGQFVPGSAKKTGAGYHFQQSLEAPYYQPLARKVPRENWYQSMAERRQTEVCKLEQSATITEVKNGFQLRVQASGTNGVPVAVEISLREGGKLEGCRPAPQNEGAWILPEGYAVYRSAKRAIRIGPGSAPHLYTQLRGAEPRLPGQSLYVTGFAPFDHTITFECL